ncbi:MAG: glutamate--tRNA ligase [Lentisphaeria bacterium]|nr:glutamate--tRNA ligase [Lentisphaeria bacterium]
MEFRARFAPSPTGQVHIGNIRTAIFNWLCCRHAGGTFLLRIEDTDLERSTKQAIDTLLECMQWLGLDYDEEPMYQTKQCAKHLAAAETIRTQGNAYKADPAVEASPLYFRIPVDCDDFPFVRTVGNAEVTLAAEQHFLVNRAGLTFFTLSAKGKPVETQACLAGFKDLKVYDAAGNVLFALNAETLPEILDSSATFECDNAAKITYTKREVSYHDMVKGDLSKPLDSMRDFIIIRSDGSPVFHLANVWDDIDQRVTHIVRGDDHVENTYRHLFLFHLLGYPVPVYAHLPMIVNKQGKPYSKRDGDAFVGDFRDKGILPEALFNYLTLLGWAPGDDREKMSTAELVEAFQIERAQHSPAQFDQAKLANMNGLYIAEMPDERFIGLAWDFAQRMDWFGKAEKVKFDEVAKLMKSRTKVFTDLAAWGYFFNDELEYDAKGVRKFMGTSEQRDGLNKLADGLENGTFNTPEDVENFIRATEQACGMGEFQLNQPLRVAATGTTVGAGMYETVLILGTAETAKRIRTALEKNPLA